MHDMILHMKAAHGEEIIYWALKLKHLKLHELPTMFDAKMAWRAVSQF